MMTITDFPHLPILPRTMINKYHIPKIKLSFNKEGIETFNEVYQWMRNYDGFEEWTRLQPTASGGIPTGRKTLIMPAYMILEKRTSIELILLCVEGQFRFIIGSAKDDTTGVTGQDAYNKFCSVCRKFGINIEDLAIDNGKAVKDTIPSPKIDVAPLVSQGGLFGQGMDIPNCHHIDINSAFMAVIGHYYPVLQPAIKYIYEKRKADTTGTYKAILTHAYGYFQSQWCRLKGHGYALAHLSKAAITGTNTILDNLAKELEAAGRNVLLYNTDGLWYEGDIYHNYAEGTALGQWKHDYTNCVLNIKSKGAYQFVGTETKTGKTIFKPVLRGVSTYERIVPRSEWKWNDIYKGINISYKFDEERGIIDYEEKELIGS